MKKINLLILNALFLFLSTNAFAQFRVDNTGNSIVRYGTFSPSSPAVVYLGDYNHYIKSVFGSGVYIGTYGGVDAIRIPQFTGAVGIYRAPSYTLDVNGSIRANTTIYTSDIRYKKNIVSFSGHDKLKKLNALSYSLEWDINKEKPAGLDTVFNNEKYIKTEGGKIERKHFGFSAQEVQKLFPDVVYEDKNGILGIDYISFIPMLVEAYKDQQIEIEQMKLQLQQLTNSPEVKSTKAMLGQNSPNPFKDDTDIKFLIPEESKQAMLCFYDMQGSQIKSVRIQQKGEAKITIHGKEFKPGIYLYSLIIDNQVIDTKKMVLTD